MLRRPGPYLNLVPSVGEEASPTRWLPAGRCACRLLETHRSVDPEPRSGTIIVHGTWSRGEWARPGTPFHSAVSSTFGAPARVFTWSGGNGREARAEAACRLAEFIRAHRVEPEPLNIVAHSHGGNVVKIYTQLPHAQPIGVLVTLGTPQRMDYSIAESFVAWYVNVFSRNDLVQIYGGKARSLGQASRLDHKAHVNREISTVEGSRVGHSELYAPSVWRSIEPDVKCYSGLGRREGRASAPLDADCGCAA